MFNPQVQQQPGLTQHALLQGARTLASLVLPDNALTGQDPQAIAERAIRQGVLNGLKALAEELTDPRRIQEREEAAKKEAEDKARIKRQEEADLAKKLLEAQQTLLTAGSSPSALTFTRRNIEQLREMANSFQAPPETRQSINMALAYLEGIVEQREKQAKEATQVKRNPEAEQEDRDRIAGRRRQGAFAELAERTAELVGGLVTRRT